MNWRWYLRNMQWGNLFSLQIWLSSLLLATILAALVRFNISVGAQYPVFVTLFLGIPILAANPWNIRHCPYCRSRVKGSASVCAYCGNSTRPDLLE